MPKPRTNPFDQALMRADAMADHYFGPNRPVDLDADGYTCDEIGAIAGQYAVDAVALLEAVITHRDATPLRRGFIPSGNPCWQAPDAAGRIWSAIWLADATNGWSVWLSVHGTEAERNRTTSEWRTGPAIPTDGLPVWSERHSARTEAEFRTVAALLLTLAVAQSDAASRAVTA